MAGLDLIKINSTARRVQKLCEKIAETEDHLDALAQSPGSIRLQAVLSGFSCEVDEGRPKYLQLGDEHRAWVIQHLQQRVLDFQNELKEIGQFV